MIEHPSTKDAREVAGDDSFPKRFGDVQSKTARSPLICWTRQKRELISDNSVRRPLPMSGAHSCIDRVRGEPTVDLPERLVATSSARDVVYYAAMPLVSGHSFHNWKDVIQQRKLVAPN